MPRRSSVAAIALVASLTLSGCHTMRFEVGEGRVGEVVHDRKSFFLAGLAPTRNVDVASFCPAGAVAVEEETTFLDGLLGLVTLSIYTPRSSTYYCAVEESQ